VNHIGPLIQTIALYALPIIFAITFHEAAHGYAARYFGDDTAHREGRISLNPFRHIDPLGTIAVPLLILLVDKFTGANSPMFGWAKPVPVNFNNLRDPKKNMLWVAAAGPAANLLMAMGWGAVIIFAQHLPRNYYSMPMVGMAVRGIEFNVVLMVLNLFPLPPLDGGRIAVSLLPNRLARGFAKIEPYGIMLLVLLLFTGVLGYVLAPFVTFMLKFIVSFFGIR
jgi:Zn-dependent protease